MLRGYSKNKWVFPATGGPVSPPVLIALSARKFSSHFRRCANTHYDSIVTKKQNSYDWIFFPATATGVSLKPL